MTINRRNMIAGTVAVVAAPTPAISQDSQLPALIAAHRDAWRAFDDSLDATWAAEEHYKEHCQKSRMVLVHDGHWLEINTATSSPWWRLRDDYKRDIARVYQDARARVPKSLSPDVRAAAIADLNRGQRAAYRRFLTVIDEIAEEQERLGLIAPTLASSEASAREEQAAMALLAYPCQTLAEARAKVAYIDSEDGSGRLISESLASDGEYVDAFLSSFREQEA